MIYREGLPSIVNELGDKALNARIIKPVRESALTWDPAGGELEVVSKNREDRKKVAQLFTSEVMGYKQDPGSLPLKQYDLDVLWDHPSFDTDITDGIASVSVVQLIFMNRKSYGLYTVKPQNVNRYRMDVYELLKADQLENVYTRDRFLIHSAKLTVKYRRVQGEKTHTITFDITMPNRCNLKDKRHIEKALNNHLLERWGLLREGEQHAAE